MKPLWPKGWMQKGGECAYYQHLAHIWNVTSLQEAHKLQPEHKTNEEFVTVLVYTQDDFLGEWGSGSPCQDSDICMFSYN